MVDAMKSSKNVAASWWKLFEEPEVQHELSDSARQDLFDVQDLVYRLSQDPEQLGALLRDLSATATSPENLRFIGTSVLEDAYQALGAQVFVILEESGISPEKQKGIRSGFLF
jgi:hypothetical protein